MNEKIQSNLALQIAQLALDKATLQAQLEQLQQQKQQLMAELEQATAPAVPTESEVVK